MTGKAYGANNPIFYSYFWGKIGKRGFKFLSIRGKVVGQTLQDIGVWNFGSWTFDRSNVKAWV